MPAQAMQDVPSKRQLALALLFLNNIFIYKHYLLKVFLKKICWSLFIYKYYLLKEFFKENMLEQRPLCRNCIFKTKFVRMVIQGGTLLFH